MSNTAYDLNNCPKIFDDLLDYNFAVEILERVRNGEEQLHSSAAVKIALGLEV